MARKGRIGNGKYVHRIVLYHFQTQWGVSRCGKWAGKVKTTTDNYPLCPDCWRKKPV